MADADTTNINLNPSNIIKLNKFTHTIETPIIILKKRNFDVIGEIKYFTNWNINFQANAIDEISFDVYKELDGEKCEVWDKLIDLAIIEVKGYGHFEINVNVDESNEIVKNITGQSLETELGQLVLHDFHVNDDDATTMEETDYNKDDFDDNGNFIPTVFYKPDDEKHSLLHRVLADKAHHWHIGHVPTHIAVNKTDKPELVETFQRIYTVDGTNIYDFLMNDVAKESNVIFTFDTYSRTINCYNAEDYTWVNPDNNEESISIDAIGEDTTILIDKDNIANQITISGDKDSVKNCFRVSGGDDVITARVAAVNMTGDNYIWAFSKPQLDDMSEQLHSSITSYQKDILENEEVQESYYGNGKIQNFINGTFALKVFSEMDAYTVLTICGSNEIKVSDVSIDSYINNPYWYVTTSEDSKVLNVASSTSKIIMTVTDAYNTMGIFSRLCTTYDLYYYLESELMPNVELGETSADIQYQNVIDGFASLPVGVYSYSNYDDNLFVGITNSIESLACVFLDSRYKIEIIDGSTSYDSTAHKWYGRIKIYRTTDETDSCKTPSNKTIEIQVTEGELEYTRQKILKALAKGDMSEVDEQFELDIKTGDSETVINQKKEKLRDEVYDYFYKNYCRVRLQSFYDGYESCLSILGDLSAKNDSIVATNLQAKYSIMTEEVGKVLILRTSEVEEIQDDIDELLKEQSEFQNNIEFKKYMAVDLGLGEETAKKLYTEYCMYRRDDEYQNDNYISDSLTDSEITVKAKELLTVAKEEIKKACVLQRSISTDLNNLLIMPEFEPLYDKFALFNYIRVIADDELFKLRLLSVQYDSNSPEKINVTFSENIESIDGSMSDLESMYKTVTSMATTYTSTVKQAKSGEKANNEFTNLYTNGLNAALMRVTSSDNNEVTLGEYGLLCKEMLDEGIYSSNQVRLIGRGLYITTDNWQTVRACLGETTDGNFGLIADSVVGKLLIGEKLFVSNETGSVEITGDGINIKSGYLRLEKDGCSVEIDPMQKYKTSNTNIISINSDGDNIFYITRDGNGYFKGEINAAKGTFSGVLNAAKGTFSGVLNAAKGTFSGDLSSASIKLINPNSEINKGMIRLTTLTESSTGEKYKVCDLSNDYASDSDLIGVTLSIKNTDTTNYYATTGIGVYKKNGAMFNKLYGNTYIGSSSTAYIGSSSGGYGGIYASESIHTPRVYAGDYVHGDYALDVNGESYFSNKITLSSGTYLNGLTGGGIYCSGQFNTEGIICIGNTNYGSSLNVKGDIFSHSVDGADMVHMIVQNNTGHKGALAVNGSSFGLWDFTYNKWMIHVNNSGEVIVAKTISDKKLKKNIKETSVNNALEQILTINHKEFDFIQGNRHKDIGYIAQELEEINPLMVNKPDSEDDVYTVDSFYMESIITKAIQEFYHKYIEENKQLKEKILKLEQSIMPI